MELEKDAHLSAADKCALDGLITALEDQAIGDTKSAVGQLKSPIAGHHTPEVLVGLLVTLTGDSYGI